MSLHLDKSEPNQQLQKTMARLGRLKRICKDALRLAGAVQETSPSDMWSGRCFPEKGCILERHIVRFTKMILLARASTAPSTCNFCRLSRRIARFNIFNLHFCRKSRTFVSFFTASTSIFVGSLAELLRFYIFNLKFCRSLTEGFHSYIFNWKTR